MRLPSYAKRGEGAEVGEFIYFIFLLFSGRGGGRAEVKMKYWWKLKKKKNRRKIEEKWKKKIENKGVSSFSFFFIKKHQIDPPFIISFVRTTSKNFLRYISIDVSRRKEVGGGKYFWSFYKRVKKDDVS